jgi:aminoglycoside phosphotransferase (APT) family kinase protein
LFSGPSELLSARRSLVTRALRAGVDPVASVESIDHVSGGNSRETWLCETTLCGTPQRVVFRCDPDHWIRPREMKREICGLKLAAKAGVPAPRILVSSQEADIGRPYFVTTFVGGTAIARRVLRDDALVRARKKFAAQCGEILARLHRAAADAEGWEPYDPIAELHKYSADSTFPSPTLLGAVRWLEENRPPSPAKLAPVHRDFRLGNLMIDETGIVAVLDWETCQIGDPEEDLAWLCSRSWRYGEGLPVGGIGSMNELLDSYERASGRKIDHARLKWWSVFAETRWGLAGTVRQRGGSPGEAMEQAALIRRGCRQEHNVLLELKQYVRR